MAKSKLAVQGVGERPAQTDTVAHQGRSVDECLVCGDIKEIVSRGLCDSCRKRTARESLDQAAKRRVVNERAECHRLLKIYQHFQSGYLQLGLQPQEIAAELLGLRSRCAAQFAPVQHLLNPSTQAKSGSGRKGKASTSNLSTPVISAAANGTGTAAPNGAATESKPSTLTATPSPESAETPDGTGTETTEEAMETLEQAAPRTGGPRERTGEARDV